MNTVYDNPDKPRVTPQWIELWRYMNAAPNKIYNKLWWKFVPGTEFVVRWPRGPVEQCNDWAASLTASADPN